MLKKYFCIRNIKNLQSSLMKGGRKYKEQELVPYCAFRYTSFSYRNSLFQVELIYKGQDIHISLGTGIIQKSFLFESFNQ